MSVGTLYFKDGHTEEKMITKLKTDFEKFIDAWNECGLVTPLTTSGSTFTEPEDGVDAY